MVEQNKRRIKDTEGLCRGKTFNETISCYIINALI